MGKLAITNNLPFLIAAITRALAVNGGGMVLIDLTGVRAGFIIFVPSLLDT